MLERPPLAAIFGAVTETMRAPLAAEHERYCPNCDATRWVCEEHPTQPWRGLSNRYDACDCGPGAPCLYCNPLAGNVLRSIETIRRTGEVT
jgi:hypothetical protein